MSSHQSTRLRSRMSARSGCEQSQQTNSLFDRLVDARGQCRRHFDTKRPRGYQVDNQLEFGRRLQWKLTRSLAFKNAINVFRGLGPLIDLINAVIQQSAVLGVIFEE